MTEQHILYVRLNTLAARRAAAKFLRNLEDDDPTVVEDFDFDGRRPNGTYWAIRMMGERGRIRYPLGHAQAGTLVPGHFIIVAWQGTRASVPDKIEPFVLTPSQFDTIYPGFPPEVA